MDLMKRIKNGVTRGQKSNATSVNGSSATNRHQHQPGHSALTSSSPAASTIPATTTPGPSNKTTNVQVHVSKSSVTAPTITGQPLPHKTFSNGNLGRKSSKMAHSVSKSSFPVPLGTNSSGGGGAGGSNSGTLSMNRTIIAPQKNRRPRVTGTWMERLPAELPKTWSNLWSGCQICDAVLISKEGKKHPVHRIILASACPYFKNLFLSNPHPPKKQQKGKGGPDEKLTYCYSIDLDSETLEQILTFAYTSHCNLTQSNVRKLLPAAHAFSLLGLSQQCFSFLLNQMTPQNCLDIWKFSKAYACPKLRSEGKLYILYNFKQIIKFQEYLELNYDEFEEIIKDDMLNIRNEEILFDAVKKWVEWKPAVREARVLDLFNCVHWGLMSYRYFTMTVLTWKFVENNPIVHESLFEAQMFLASLESRNGTDIDLNDPLARPRVPYEIIFAIGGWSAGSPTSFMETYDGRADRWFLTPGSDVMPRAYHGLVTVGQMIYMVGGFDGNDHFNTVRCFNPVTRTWTDKANMYYPRCYISCCALDGLIYAMGGFNGRTRMNSVERYDPATNQWEMLASMNRQRSDASACSLNGKVYVAGGFNGQEVLNSVEVYSPEEDQWTFIRPMRSPRSGVAIIGYKDWLYAIGGFNGFNRLATVEKYDPNNPNSEWITVAEMSSPRSNFAAAVMDELIFVIGGFNGTTTIPYVECYDELQNEWFDAAHMNLNRSALAACVLTGLPNAQEYSYLSRIQEIIGIDNEIHPIHTQSTTNEGFPVSDAPGLAAAPAPAPHVEF